MAAALVVLAVLVGLVLVVVGRGDGAGDPRAATGEQPGSTRIGAPTEVAQGVDTTAAERAAQETVTTTPMAAIASSMLSATASSALAPVPSKGLSYGPENVLDANDQTVWSQDGSDGGIPAEGSWLRLSSASALDVDQITIVNGYIKNADVYAANARLRRVVLTTDRGDRQMVDLLDHGTPQAFLVNFGGIRWIEIEVVSVYPGDKHSDVAITQVDLRGRRS